MSLSPKKLIVGCGYLGERVARLWRDAGAAVAVVTRSPQKAEAFRAQGYQPVVADITDPTTLTGLPPAETVLFAVGHDRSAGQPIEQVYVDGLRHTLAALQHPPDRFVYISSTGVYGQTDGEVVDEKAPCRPTRTGGRACLAAEQLLQESTLADRAIILRLAGIYGPGRHHLLDALRAGAAEVAGVGDHRLNLIHRDDIVAAILAVLAAPAALAGGIFNVADDGTAAKAEVAAWLSARLGRPAPAFTGSPAGGRRRVTPDRVIANDRLKAALGWRPQYASYREGYEAILTGERARPGNSGH